MFLKAGRFEIEIREDAFVCLEEGKTSHFCEWSRLDPGLQKTFRDLRLDLLKVMNDFLRSEKNQAFLGVSETYEDTPIECNLSTRDKTDQP